VKVTEKDGVLSRWDDCHGVTSDQLRAGLTTRSCLDNTMSAAAGEHSLPSYVYKILSEEPPNPLPHALPLTPLDKQDGFIHLSAGWRVPQTAAQFFGSYRTIWLLRVDTNAALAEEAQFRWGEDAGCMHMYARDEGRWARLGAGVVVAVGKFEKEIGEEWEKVVARAVQDGWLA